MLLLLVAGCNRIFGLEETQPFDAPSPRPDAVGCSGKMFVGPEILTEFDVVPGRAEFDPSESADRQELWFSSSEPASAELDLSWSGKLATGSWGPSTFASFNLPNVLDADPALTDDGLRLVFVSNRSGGAHAWEVTRAAIGQPFGVAALLRGVDAYTFSGLDLTLDGRTLYWSAGDGELHVAHRATVNDPFVAEMVGSELRVIATNAAYVSISPDERELFYNHPGEFPLFRRVRVDTTAAFDPTEEVVYASGGDSEISADGQRLYFVDSFEVKLARRDCP